MNTRHLTLLALAATVLATTACGIERRHDRREDRRDDRQDRRDEVSQSAPAVMGPLVINRQAGPSAAPVAGTPHQRA